MWFNKNIENVLQELNVDAATGLSDAEVSKRLEIYGHNKLKAQQRKSVIRMFLEQMNDWLIYVLMAAVIITIFLSEYIDAVIILAVIIINAVLGVYQELKANKAIEALQKMSSPKSLLRRNGQVVEVEADNIVPGDIIILETGRFVGADLRLIEDANLQIEESALTGESVPAEKKAHAVAEDPETPLGDRENMAFMSTMVTYGRGTGVAVETGMNTEIGKIADIIENEAQEKTPLEKRLDELGKTLGFIAIGICVLIFILSWVQGRDLAEMFLTSVSLAVASIPEGLAAIVAVVLSIGVTQMSKRNAIIKRLPAVETLGSVNIICSDKTGTLTQNKMTVVKYFTSEGVVKIDRHSDRVSNTAALLTTGMILASDATYEDGKGTGDPTEIALLAMGDTLQIDRKQLNEQYSRENELAFDSDRKLMSTLVKNGNKYRVFTKGAIGSLLDISTHYLVNGEHVPMTEDYKKQIKAEAGKMSDEALRTLGLAYREAGSYQESDELERDLTFVGFVGMIDPPREEVKPSIALAKSAGITTIMITGDHKNTAFAIGKDLGIADDINTAITGKEFDKIPEAELAEKVKDYRIYARVSPEHKVKIVRGLKANGNIVSMTGDGVNDAPSLNAADIGVAMGITGTDVAKGAADMILTDDNFSTIVKAIEQGRNIYNNIKKSVIFLLTCNLGEVIAMFVSLLIGWQAPLIATQLLWINLITDSLPAIALGMDPGDPDVMKDKPRPPKESFFANGAGLQAILGGLLIGGLTIVAYWYGYYEHGYAPHDADVPADVLEYARTMAFMVLVCSQLFYALAIRSRTKLIVKIGVFSNKVLIGAIVAGIGLQLLVMLIPFMRDAFKLQMLDSKGWLMAIGLGLVPLLLAELHKLFIKKKPA
ncbi:cation-translocating P-type ATPase [Haoranjiania flava]|uniref:Cation-translocating P-type ATPase n=1 Tax=Haoranjiania flava TaxID=1856322 RepID=A0AAE3IRC8_9BACT|nr:cation-translocating P-type ATPase [Haoranjiania flava]MCU7694996.1 cation-translocating P-type ATPase [Haoranjiania flava]